MLTGTGFYLHP